MNFYSYDENGKEYGFGITDYNTNKGSYTVETHTNSNGEKIYYTIKYDDNKDGNNGVIEYTNRNPNNGEYLGIDDGLTLKNITISNTNKERVVITWWHNASAPFFCRIEFNKTYSKYRIILYKSETGHYYGSSTEVHYAGPFYVGLELKNSSEPSISNFTYNKTSMFTNGIYNSDVYLNNNGYKFEQSNNCIVYVPRAQTTDDNYKNDATYPGYNKFQFINNGDYDNKDVGDWLNVDDYSFKSGNNQKFNLSASCWYTAADNNAYQCMDFEENHPYGYIIKNVTLDIYYPPSNMTVTKNANATSIYPTFKWRSGSVGSYTFHYTISYTDTNGTKKSTNGSIVGQNGSGTKIELTGIKSGTTSTITYYLTESGNSTHFCEGSTTITTYGLSIAIDEILFHAAYFKVKYTKESNISNKVIKYQVLDNNNNVIDFTDSDNNTKNTFSLNNGNASEPNTWLDLSISDLNKIQPGAKYKLKVWLDGVSGSTTYKNFETCNLSLSIVTDQTTTKDVAFRALMSVGSNDNSDNHLKLMYSISGGNTTNSDKNQKYPNNGVIFIRSNLIHNTLYTITAWIDGFKYDYDDSVNHRTLNISTKELTLSIDKSFNHQHSIITNWIATPGYDFISCDLNKTSCIAFTRDGYKTADEDKKTGICSVPVISVNTSDNNVTIILNSTGLDYYTLYTIKCTITDGFNEISKSVNINTTFPYTYIYGSDSVWHKTIPYIYNGTKWVPAVAFIYDGTEFKESDGEAQLN